MSVASSSSNSEPLPPPRTATNQDQVALATDRLVSSPGDRSRSSENIGSRSPKHSPALSDPNGSGDDTEDIYIAIMGVTGAGKSQFIKACSRSKSIKIGDTLFSCTKDVDEHKFMYRDMRIHLIDTPGFDDTTRTDREVLDEVARWFGTAYQANIELTGILYLHRISDPRMAGTALSNLRMFKKLCGKSFYPRVALATTFWDTVGRREAERREAELKVTDEFWGRMVEHGSKTYRHYGDRDSAMDILMSIIRHRKDEERSKAPSYVQMQREIAEENKSLDETSAGQEVNAKILAERKKFERELREVREDMQVAMEENDRRAQELLRKHQAVIEEKVRKGYEDQAKLNVKLEELQEKHLQETERLLNAIDEQRRIAESYKTQIRVKDEKLRKLDSRSSAAVALTREIANDKAHLEETQEKLKEQTATFEQKKNVLLRVYKWAKKHPQVTAQAGMIAVRFIENALAAHRLRLVERHRQSQMQTDTEYELVETDDESTEGGTHESPADSFKPVYKIQ